MSAIGVLLQVCFCIERELDHSFEQFIGRHTGEIVAYQFFAEQAADIAQLPTFLFAGIYKIPVSVVDDDHVLL